MKEQVCVPEFFHCYPLQLSLNLEEYADNSAGIPDIVYFYAPQLYLELKQYAASIEEHIPEHLEVASAEHRS